MRCLIIQSPLQEFKHFFESLPYQVSDVPLIQLPEIGIPLLVGNLALLKRDYAVGIELVKLRSNRIHLNAYESSKIIVRHRLTALKILKDALYDGVALSVKKDWDKLFHHILVEAP